MERTVTIWTMFFVLGGFFCQCKDKYVSPYKSPSVGYLVVEGFISGNTPIQYTLSRTLPLPIQTLQENSEQVSYLYSILVYQSALTDSGYNYMSILQKNTESLGSIFDVQSSQLVGNIHCLTKPMEQVIGYISAGTIQQQRIFIHRYQVPGWVYSFSCSEGNIVVPLDSLMIRKAFAMDGKIPIDPHIVPPIGHQIIEP